MPEPTNLRLLRLKKVAHFATKNDDAKGTIKQFRTDAVSKNGFRQAFGQALEQFPNDLLELNEEEIAYCEGWALLARHGLDHWYSGFDDEVVKAMNAHLKEVENNPSVRSG